MSGSAATARALGYAGLIPFVVFSAGTWIRLPYVDQPTATLVAYAAVILSFMGAVHWGLAMAHHGDDRGRFFVASVAPPLAAWMALLLPDAAALSVLLIGFTGLWVYDRSTVIPQGMPDWYLPLRSRLTLVVSLCLVGALLSGA